MSTADTPEGRAKFVAGLRELADLLEADESLPVPYSANLQAGPTSSASDGVEGCFAAVRAFAQRFGTDVIEYDDGHREAVRKFGPIKYYIYASGRKRSLYTDGRRIVAPDEDAVTPPLPEALASEPAPSAGAVLENGDQFDVEAAPHQPAMRCPARHRIGKDSYRCARDEDHWDAALPGHDPARADHYNPRCGAWPAFEAATP